MSEHLTQPERIAKLEVELGDAEDRVAKLEADLEAARRSARLAQDAHDIARARVVKLAAALERVHPHICAFGSDEELAVIDAALSETVEA